MTVDAGLQSLAGKFFNAFRLCQVQAAFFRRFDDAAGNGVIRRLFHRCTEAEHLAFVKAIGRQDLMDDEVSFGNRPGLIKDDSADIFKLFDGDTAFKQDALLRRGTDAGKEAEGDAEYQGAGAADDQEGQSRIDPVMPFARNQGRDDSRSRGDSDDGRRIDARKASDKAVDLRFSGRRFFDGFQNFSNHRFGQRFRNLDVEDARRIDAARHDFSPFMAGNGDRFPGQSRRIEKTVAGNNDAVQGDAVADTDDSNVFYSSITSRNFNSTSIFHKAVDDVRPHIDSSRHLLPAAVDGPFFHSFPDTAEEHDGHGFRVVPDGKGTDGSYGHEEIFIEGLALHDIFSRFAKDTIAEE